MAVHQTAKFFTNSKAFHDAVVKRISKHFLGTSDEVLMNRPNEDKGLEVLLDAFLLVYSMEQSLKILRLHNHEFGLSSSALTVQLHEDQNSKYNCPYQL